MNIHRTSAIFGILSLAIVSSLLIFVVEQHSPVLRTNKLTEVIKMHQHMSPGSKAHQTVLRAGEECYKCSVKVKCKKQCDFIVKLCGQAPKDTPGANECKAYNTKCRGEQCATEKWPSRSFAEEYQIWVKKLLCFTGARDNFELCYRGAGSDDFARGYCKTNMMRSANEC